MTTDFRALCVELTDCLEKADWPHRYKTVFQQWVDISRAALAEPDGPAVPEGREPASVAKQPTEPEAEGPTDEQLNDIADETPWRGSPRHFGREVARAVLARWAHPAATPVPVSERLPGPEDCDAEGRCWLGGHQMGSETPTWLLGYPAWAERFPDVHRFWLPANALPLPAPEGGEVSR